MIIYCFYCRRYCTKGADCSKCAPYQALSVVEFINILLRIYKELDEDD